jgi:CP family cyanate transporter-like MFS transporter
VERQRTGAYLVLTAMVALAFNLRPGAVSFGPVLDEARAALGMGDVLAGIVTTLPVLCFAVFGAVAPPLASRLGIHRLVTASIAVSAAGLVVRAEAESTAVFIAASVPALAGMAAANVLLPALVHEHFPDQVGLVTGVYTTALAVGLTAAAVLTVPIAHAGGTWRWGLLGWGFCAGIAIVPWLGLVRGDQHRGRTDRSAIPTSAVARSGLAWSLAFYFGLQSIQAYCVFGWLPQIYRDAGFSATTAGYLLGIVMAVGIPLSFALARLVGSLTDPRPLILGLAACYIVSYVGLILWPVGGAVVWAFLAGIAAGNFPLALTLIGMRARTREGTAALSGFAQGVGYLLASVGPVGTGVLHDLTGGWTVPLLVLCLIVLPQTVAGTAASKSRYLEDELPSAASVRS